MDLIYMILQKAIDMDATDIHLVPDISPIYRVKRKLNFDSTMLPMSSVTLFELVDFFSKNVVGLKNSFDERKQSDFPYTYKNYRFRINVSFTKGSPTFSIRVIPNGDIDIENLGIAEIVKKMKKINSGLVLLTGKVNSGKSTTMNAYIQEVNKVETKKIVSLEDPIEYVHRSNKCAIVQKEIGRESDVLSYNDGLINLLREDSDINIIGEIRDYKTMDVVIDLAESGGLVLGTLHTRSCGETIERIVNMYEPADQMNIKTAVSSILKMVVSQKLVVGTKGNLVLVPEIMMVNPTIAAQIRQPQFSVSDLEDAIHSQREMGCLSYEYSFADLYLKGAIDMKVIRENVDQSRLDIIKGLIVNGGGVVGL
ncbi:MAG: ATPase, T2SS/T4P/T4SS family [Clostridia bacterium]|nr:ATPase, T2SS/T4P/T4SS family [Clostridia bacterium]